MKTCIAGSRPLTRRVFTLSLGVSTPPVCRASRVYTTAKSPSDPLRILFCGSDAFSCASLKALHSEHARNRSLVESLEVMVLPGKRTGRGLKHISEVPCKQLAEELGLEVHQRPTFRGWNLPKGTNLVVAVSFGLFVPTRILQSAKYGGLNVHPSLLPDLRGPAPVHHALLHGNKYTGVSLQTLDDKAFDHGTVLAQTPLPGIEIPKGVTLAGLTEQLAAVGANMLVQGLRDGVHIPPYQDAAWDTTKDTELRHAPKVSKEDAKISWHLWTADEWHRRRQVFGSIWTTGITTKDSAKKRVIFTDFEVISSAAIVTHSLRAISVQLGDDNPNIEMLLNEQGGNCYLRLTEGSTVRIGKVLVDGKKEQVAAIGLKPFMKNSK